MYRDTVDFGVQKSQDVCDKEKPFFNHVINKNICSIATSFGLGSWLFVFRISSWCVRGC